jgi:hypothetical protein
MKNLFFYILVIGVSSCYTVKPHEKSYFGFSKTIKDIKIPEFQEIDEFEIPADTLMKYQLFEDDSFYTITGYKHQKNEIYTYKINKNTKKNSVHITKLNMDIMPPFDSGYISDDSLIFVFPPAYRDFYHDSIVFITDQNGNILKSVSFENAPVLSKENKQYENNDNAVNLEFNIYQDFTYKDNKLFLTFSSKTQFLGDPAFAKFPLQVILTLKPIISNV